MDPKLLFISLTIFAVARTDDCKTCNPYENLFDFIFTKYNKYVLPVEDTTNSIEVKAGVSIINLLEFDELKGFGVFSLWEKMTWTDYRLQWDPKEFSDVLSIRVPSDHLWIPDIVPYNSDLDRDVVRDNNAVVSYDGQVLNIKAVQRGFPCHNNGTILACLFKYGSWTYDGFQINLQRYNNESDSAIFDDFYGTHLPYKAFLAHTNVNVKYYPCCAEPYPDITTNAYFKVIHKTCGEWFGLC